MTEPIVISLDRKHIAQRYDRTWELAKLEPDGTYTLIERWIGNRRSLFHKMEGYGIVPSREAEQALLLIPEQPSFREDEPKHRKA
jgi:hypothetical protein